MLKYRVLQITILVWMIIFCSTMLLDTVEAGWNTVASPIPGVHLREVFMLSANDGWAVGYDGITLRWDGTNWYGVSNPSHQNLLSIDMVSSNDGWAVGYDILRWDGATWTSVYSGWTAESIDMVSSNDGWAVGYGGTIHRWDGATWSTVTSPTPNQLNSVYMVSSNDGWAVGNGGIILHWDGATWSTVTSPTTVTLSSVHMISSSDGWAVGSLGTTIQWDGTNWKTVTSITPLDLRSVFMVSPNDVWAVGQWGTIMHWDGVTWDMGSSPYTQNWLISVNMVSSDDGWAVGMYGDMFQFTPEPQAPSASFTSSPSSPEVGETVTFDASGSSDPDGTIIDYEWNFGDGSTGTGETITHSYSSAGTYTVEFAVTDNDGLTDVDTKTIIVTAPPEPPTASFASSTSSPKVGETVTFDASDSSDPDGNIVAYDWNFGDGIGTGMTATHSYSSDGTYTVTLTVTDNEGLTDTATKTIAVTQIPDENQTPVASFTNSPTSPKVGETVTFDASGSSDPDGTVTNYAWDFGDGNTGIGATTSHSYSSTGTYIVQLMITDNDGLTDTATKTITVTAGPGPIFDDEDPVANAGSDRTVNAGSTVPFSGASSTDNVGIVSYEWDFGDGTTGTGMSLSHTFEVEGDYTVALTVRDAAGNSNTVTILITVKESAEGGFPFWILIPIIIAAVVVILLWFFFFRKRKPIEKVPKPTKIRVTVDPNELLADGKSKSSIIIELLDKDGNPVSANSDTEIKLNSTMGKIEKPLTKIPKGKDKGESILVSSRSAGNVTLSADAKGLKGTTITVTFKETIRYCMHCGYPMSLADKKCPRCRKSPPAGVDTKVCRKCGAVIPVVAKYCPECGTNQAKEIRY